MANDVEILSYFHHVNRFYQSNKIAFVSFDGTPGVSPVSSSPFFLRFLRIAFHCNTTIALRIALRGVIGVVKIEVAVKFDTLIFNF